VGFYRASLVFLLLIWGSGKPLLILSFQALSKFNLTNPNRELGKLEIGKCKNSGVFLKIHYRGKNSPHPGGGCTARPMYNMCKFTQKVFPFQDRNGRPFHAGKVYSHGRPFQYTLTMHTVKRIFFLPIRHCKTQSLSRHVGE